MITKFLLTISIILAKTVCEGEKFCLSGTNSVSQIGSAPSDNQPIVFTVLSSSKGWAAMGFGSSMINAVIVTGWQNSTNGYTITTMTTGKDKVIPSVSATQIAHPVDLARSKPDWANIAFSFQIHQDNALHFLTESDNYIWVNYWITAGIR